MADDDKGQLAKETERQAAELKKANPDAKVDVKARKDGNVEVRSVKVSTEKKD
jgi:hypothetical protein